MIKIRLPILLTALAVVFVFSSAVAALATQAVTPCPRQPGPDWSCHGINLQGPTAAEPVACTEDPENGCMVYTWEIEINYLGAPSHLNLIIASDIADNIIEVYDGAETPHSLEWVSLCDGSGDPSTYPPFGRYLQWSCTVKISTETWSEENKQVKMKVKGESGLVNMDSMVKLLQDSSCCYDGGINLDWCITTGWGITTGPGTVCKTKSDYPITSRGNIDDIAGIRVSIIRDKNGCGSMIEYCTDPDPDNPDVCLSDWIAPLPVDEAMIEELPIIHCSDDRDPTSSLCNECSFVTGTNPSCLWYKIGGNWYEICGEEPDM